MVLLGEKSIRDVFSVMSFVLFVMLLRTYIFFVTCQPASSELNAVVFGVWPLHTYNAHLCEPVHSEVWRRVMQFLKYTHFPTDWTIA